MNAEVLALLWTAETKATFAALLCAHVFADYMFQTTDMVRRKKEPAIFARHIAIVAGTAFFALGGAVLLVAAVALAHGLIDAWKTYLLDDEVGDTQRAYLADQALHLMSLALLAIWMPGAAGQGLWGGLPLADAMLWVSGLIIATRAGEHAVRYLMTGFNLTWREETDQAIAPNAPAALPEGATAPEAGAEDAGLPDAGRVIGLLERALIFIMVMAGQPAAVGFLIAAKSVLRFDTVRKGRRASEYVIVGTLASFTWAFLAALATQALIAS